MRRVGSNLSETAGPVVMVLLSDNGFTACIDGRASSYPQK